MIDPTKYEAFIKLVERIGEPALSALADGRAAVVPSHVSTLLLETMECQLTSYGWSDLVAQLRIDRL